MGLEITPSQVEIHMSRNVVGSEGDFVEIGSLQFECRNVSVNGSLLLCICVLRGIILKSKARDDCEMPIQLVQTGISLGLSSEARTTPILL